MLSNFFFAYIMAFVGVILPGMINMTSVSVSLKQGFPAGLKYSIGASIIILIQAAIAVHFADYFSENPIVFAFFKKAAIVIFLVLSAFFYSQAVRAKTVKASTRKGAPFLVGIIIAALNPLNIPYYFTYGTILEGNGRVSLESPDSWFFIVGASLGAFTLLVGYAKFAQFISARAAFFTRNINYILSGLFFLLALIQVIKLLSGN